MNATLTNTFQTGDLSMTSVRHLACAVTSLFACIATPSLANDLVSNAGSIVESCAFGADGTVYVSLVGAYDVYGDGSIAAVKDEKFEVIARGLNDPHGIVFWQDAIYVADNRSQVWRVGLDGAVKKMADAGQFPRKVTNFNDIAVDASNGDLYISDSGDWEGGGGAIFKVTQDSAVSTIVTIDEQVQLVSPNGLTLDGKGGLLIVDWTTGNLSRLDLATKAWKKVNGGWGPADGLAVAADGSLYVGSYFQGVHVRSAVDAAEPKTVLPLVDLGMKSAADLALSPDGKTICVADFDGQAVLVRQLAKNQ
jgi:DNA-binding beta-propeller fold protein YncE